MIDEGVTKFSCVRTPGPALDEARVAQLERWRARLLARGLIGYDLRHRVGYGNLSRREPGTGAVIITGTQTGHLPVLGGAHYCVVDEWDLAANAVVCTGPVDASSETLTHAALYDASPDVGAVFHVHCARAWSRLCGILPTTRADAAYGTLAMARELARLYRESDLVARGVAAMAGHEGGLVAIGSDPDQAGRRLVDTLGSVDAGP